MFIYFCKKERLNTNWQTELQKRVEASDVKLMVAEVTRRHLNKIVAACSQFINITGNIDNFQTQERENVR